MEQDVNKTADLARYGPLMRNSQGLPPENARQRADHPASQGCVRAYRLGLWFRLEGRRSGDGPNIKKVTASMHMLSTLSQ